MGKIFKSADEIEAAGKAYEEFLSRIEKAKILGKMNDSETIVHTFKCGFYRGIEFERQNKRKGP
jgi:hypothetical protein